MKTRLINSFIIALFTLTIYSCKDSSTAPPVETPSLKGTFVLYQSASAGGSDYAYIDAAKDTIFNNLYQNANGNVALEYSATDMKMIDGLYIYVLCAGLPGQNGKFYKVNTKTNQTTSSRSVGTNPGRFTINNDNIFVSSTGASFVSRLNINFGTVVDPISVSSGPAGIAYTQNRYLVSRSPSSIVNTLAVINETTNDVIEIGYSFKPVGIINNINGYYVSGYKRKQLYRLDSVQLNVMDSISIPTSGTALGEMVKAGQNKLYVVADSSEVWEVNFLNNPPSTRLLIPSLGGSYKISALAYEDLNDRIYVGDNSGGIPFLGKVHVFNASTGALIKLMQYSEETL
jgi:hypothetical protein